MNLFLDDERFPIQVSWMRSTLYKFDVWNIVRTGEEFKLFVIKNIKDIKVISFDHDIQEFNEDGEETGYTLLKWLVDFCLDTNNVLPAINVHSMNGIGKTNMESYLQNALDNCPSLSNKFSIPREAEPVLARIKQLNDLGTSYWYEVVYHNGENWCGYECSRTFTKCEQVVDWKYADECL